MVVWVEETVKEGVRTLVLQLLVIFNPYDSALCWERDPFEKALFYKGGHTSAIRGEENRDGAQTCSSRSLRCTEVSE